eukprot:Lankesteria_metandrocarpae@DN5032_c0_g1_i1.p1
MNDPSVKNDAIKTVQRFLTNKSFVRPVSVSELQSPTAALYYSIMEFLMLQVDRNLQAKDEEDVCAFYKNMLYPLGITKSAVKAPGIPTSWPSLLTAMAWLCEVLQLDECSLSQPEFGIEMGDGADQHFDQQILECYKSIAAGKMDEQGAHQYLEELRGQEEMILRTRISELDAAIDERLLEIERSTKFIETQKEKQSLVAKLCADSKKLASTITMCSSDCQNLSVSNEAKRITFKEKTQDLKLMKGEAEEKQAIIDKQEIHIGQVVEIESQMRAKRQKIKDIREEVASVAKERSEAENQKCNVLQNIKQMSKASNKRIDACRMRGRSEDHGLSDEGAKALRHIQLFHLSLEDTTLDGCRDESSDEDSCAADRGNEDPNILSPRTEADMLSKSTPAGVYTGRHPTRTTRRSLMSKGYNNAESIAALNSLLGLNWDSHKLTLKNVNSAETFHHIEVGEAAQKLLNDAKNRECEAETAKMKYCRTSDEIEAIEKEIKTMRRRHDSQMKDCRRAIEMYEEECRELNVDFSKRLADARKQKEKLEMELSNGMARMRTEVKARKFAVYQVASEASELVSVWNKRLSLISKQLEENCVVWENEAAQAYQQLSKSRSLSPSSCTTSTYK